MSTARRMKITGPDQYWFYRTSCSCGWCGGPWQRRQNARQEFDRHECDAP